MPQISNKSVEALKEVLETAKMERCGFSLTQKAMSNDADTEAIREATRLWRQSWIITPLREVLATVQYTAEERKAEPLRRGYFLENLRTGECVWLGGISYCSAVTAAYLLMTGPEGSSTDKAEQLKTLDALDCAVRVKGQV